MPINGLDDEVLNAILAENFSPSKEIVDPLRLFGRDDSLRVIKRAINSPGRHIFIYGDRGVGKTSVACTVSKQHNFHDEKPIYIACGQNMSFGDIMQSVGNEAIPVRDRLLTNSTSGGFGLSISGVAGVNGNLSKTSTGGISPPQTVAGAIDILRLVRESRGGQTVIVLDEIDRLRNENDKILFAELIKNTSTTVPDVRFVICGIGHTVEEILGSHPSAGRYFEPVHLERLHHNYLWDIIHVVAKATGVLIPDLMLKRISIISDGFPHFVHLLGECLFYEMQDDPETVSVCEPRHFKSAINNALNRTEHILKDAYNKATEKAKLKNEYEEALWALADTSETRRQIKDIHSRSYLHVRSNRTEGETLDRKTLNARFLTLRNDNHDKIVIGHGSGWFSFRENVMRGYVRLKAEDEGVTLKQDV